jgi:hypothetical protein
MQINSIDPSAFKGATMIAGVGAGWYLKSERGLPTVNSLRRYLPPAGNERAQFID